MDSLPSGKPTQRIICTTMKGVFHLDESRIRHTIFQTLPRSVHEFLRMSRPTVLDGELGRCTVLLSAEEMHNILNEESASVPSLLSIKATVQRIFDSGGEADRPNRYVYLPPADALMWEYQLRGDQVRDILSLIEIMGHARKTGTRMPVDCQYTVLKHFQGPTSNMPCEQARGLLALLSRKRTGALNTNRLSKETGIDVVTICKALLWLRSRGFLALKILSSADVLEAQRHPSPEAIEQLARTYHATALDVHERRLARRRAIIRVFTTAQCMMATLAEELEMRMPGGSSRCGHCTFCATGEPVVVPMPTPKPIDLAKVRAIFQGFPEYQRDPRALARIALGGVYWIGGTKITEIYGDLQSRMSRQNPLYGSMRACEFKVSMMPKHQRASFPCCRANKLIDAPAGPAAMVRHDMRHTRRQTGGMLSAIAF